MKENKSPLETLHTKASPGSEEDLSVLESIPMTNAREKLQEKQWKIT